MSIVEAMNLDHLREAKMFAEAAECDNSGIALRDAQLAVAHAAIALVELLAERLPPPAETASAAQVRLRKEGEG